MNWKSFQIPAIVSVALEKTFNGKQGNFFCLHISRHHHSFPDRIELSSAPELEPDNCLLFFRVAHLRFYKSQGEQSAVAWLTHVKKEKEKDIPFKVPLIQQHPSPRREWRKCSDWQWANTRGGGGSNVHTFTAIRVETRFYQTNLNWVNGAVHWATCTYWSSLKLKVAVSVTRNVVILEMFDQNSKFE